MTKRILHVTMSLGIIVSGVRQADTILNLLILICKPRASCGRQEEAEEDGFRAGGPGGDRSEGPRVDSLRACDARLETTTYAGGSFRLYNKMHKKVRTQNQLIRFQRRNVPASF